jgi:amino acid adenylation domain-containing protein
MSIINDIRAVAAKSPSAIAMCCNNDRMTYEQFMQRVDGLAHALHQRHIGTGDRVAIALPRSFEMIIAICGVVAAGAVYVPLDLSNPPARLMTILEDCRALLLLGNEDGEQLAASAGINRFDPSDWPASAFPLAAPVSDSAYIIYTSGSTGKPKGVEIGHAALENYVQWAMNELPFTGDGVPLFTSISFDHAVTNIFPPLLKGDTIMLLPDILGGRALATSLLSQPRHSYVKITPSLFGFLDKEQRAQMGRQTNLIMFGGEKLPPSFIADVRRDNPALDVMNHYGPTETTVGCCVYHVPNNFSGANVPIGKPIPGVQTSIRRADLSIANPGEIGELFISGVALANGYWQRPELTAEAFVHLLGDEARWYRTGDNARITPGGDIEYLGRIDDQVKILGNRIEPAEIIMHLNSFNGIKQSAVFTTGSNELVAAIAYSGNKPLAEDVRKYLQSLLPAAMVPARYVMLQELPVAASGKIDVAQLRFMLPAYNDDNAVESSVASRFREILCQDNIALDDDFFLLGGDSLGTVEIATWAAEQYHIPLEISCLFDYPTIGSLSQHIRELISSR